MLRNGVKRGSAGGTADEVVGEQRNIEPDEWAVDEGLLAFVQSTLCRRKIVTKIYGNKIHSERFHRGVHGKYSPIGSHPGQML